MISKYLLGVIAVLALGLFLMGRAYLGQRDDNVRLEHAAEIEKLTQEYVEKQQAALAAITAEYDAKITVAETEHEDRINEIMVELATAQRDALQKPIAFGDDFIRDIIRVDCLRSLGERGTDPNLRQACRDEAATADPTKSVIPFSVITPTFLGGWADACRDWRDVKPGDGDLAYTEQDWQEEYGNFDTALCNETIVAMTPEASLLFRNFLERGLNYEDQLVMHALEQAAVIDQISR